MKISFLCLHKLVTYSRSLCPCSFNFVHLLACGISMSRFCNLVINPAGLVAFLSFLGCLILVVGISFVGVK